MKTSTINKKPTITETPMSDYWDQVSLGYGLDVSEEASEARVTANGSLPLAMVEDYMKQFGCRLSVQRIEACNYAPALLDEAIVMSALIRNHLLGDSMEATGQLMDYLISNEKCRTAMLFLKLVPDSLFMELLSMNLIAEEQLVELLSNELVTDSLFLELASQEAIPEACFLKLLSKGRISKSLFVKLYSEGLIPEAFYAV